MEKLKVGLIGAGSISSFHAAGYKKLANVEIYAVCDLKRERAEASRQAFGAKYAFTDYEELLKLKELDAVSVCTWNNTHAPVTIASLQAGKHVLCEKPLATNAKEAEAMSAAAGQAGKLLMVGFVRRFCRNTRILKDFIDSGYLGDLYFAKTQYIRRCGNPCGWFSDRQRSGGGPLIDLGVHMIDLARYLMGKPKATAVSGVTFANIGPRNNIKGLIRYRAVDFDDYCNVEDFAAAFIRFDNGAVLTVETSFSQHIKEEQVALEVFGTKAGATLEPKLELHSELQDYLVDITPVYSVENDFAVFFEQEIAHFVDCIVNGTECLAPSEDGVELMRILDAIYESAGTGKEVSIIR